MVNSCQTILFPHFSEANRNDHLEKNMDNSSYRFIFGESTSTIWKFNIAIENGNLYQNGDFS